MPLNAKRARPGVPRREKYLEPRHRDVWIRIGGKWRRAKIAWWVIKPGGDRWQCMIAAGEPSMARLVPLRPEGDPATKQ